MDQLVQSAMDAASGGDKEKALELITQACDLNPSDIDALLILATLVEETARKRQVLNRVLSLEPTNRSAREMLLDMDRAEISAYISKSRGVSASSGQPEPPIALQNHQAKTPTNISLEKPRVFRVSQTWLVVLYFFTTFACCATLFVGSMSVSSSLPFLAMTIMLAVGIVTASSRVEVSEAGIRTSSLTGSAEMKWDDISSMKLNSLRRNLELTSNLGEILTVSTQVKDYNILRELLWHKRPDLFPQITRTAPAEAITDSESEPAVPAPARISQLEPTPALGQTADSAPSRRTTPKPVAEKPVIFRPSSSWMIVLWILMAFSLCTGLLIAGENVSRSLPSFGLAFLFGLTALTNTSKVEVRDSGIRASTLFSSREIQWNEISGMRSNSFKRRLELTSNDLTSVNVSSQLKGYPILIELLRQKRPDLFTEPTADSARESISSTLIEQSPSLGQGAPVPADGLAATRTFTKTFLKQYGLFLWVTPVCLLMAWFGLAVTESQLRIASLLSVAFCGLVLLLPFFQVSSVKVEPNKLTIETFFEQKEFNADQIKEIKMQAIQGRYGRVTNIINIIPMEGKKYPLGGFADGDEMVYGYLMNWWNTHQNR